MRPYNQAMATMEADLLRNILESPRESLPRLIYADYLADYPGGSGDSLATARSEFIRIGCALEQHDLSPQERNQLSRRHREMQSSFGPRWAGPVAGLAANWSFNRGFIHSIDIRADIYLSSASEIHAQHPIEHINLIFMESRNPEAGRAIAAIGHLRHIRSLGLKGAGLGSEGLVDLVASQHLGCLEWINLSGNNLGEKGVRALLRSPIFPNLRCIDLGANDLGPPCLREIAAHLTAAGQAGEVLLLETLELGGNPLTRAGARVIQGCRPLARAARW